MHQPTVFADVPPTTYDELAACVHDQGGVYYTEAGYLRDLEQVQKLGVQIRARIKEELAERGLETLPPDIPPYQEMPVIVYEADGSLTQIVEAVYDPSEESAKVLRAIAGDNSREVLAQIRDLVTPVA